MGKISVILILILTALWWYTSWYWYTCSIKWFCNTEQVVMTDDIWGALDINIWDKQPLSEEGKQEIRAIQWETIIEQNPKTVLEEKIIPKSVAKEKFIPKSVVEEIPIPELVPVITEEKKCESLIVTPMRLWGPNDTGDVKDLQDFLNAFEWESLEVDGVYGKYDFEAIKRFQLKYAADILTPWGIKEPTWYVYETTTKKINEIYCSQ